MVTTRRRSQLNEAPKASPGSSNSSPTQRLYPSLTDAEESAEEEEDAEESTRSISPPSSKSGSPSRNQSYSSTRTNLLDIEYSPLSIGIVVFVITMIVYLLCFSRGGPRTMVNRKDYGKLLGTVIKAYPTVTNRDRQQLGAAADRWFDNSTTDPIVVIIMSTDTSSNLLNDLTTSTASYLGTETTVISATPQTRRDTMHATFQNTLKGGSFSTIGVRQIEKLRWDSPLVLHAFADADHYSSSRSLIFLHLSRDEALVGSRCDDAISSILTSSWISSGGTEDNVAPVISRISQFSICLDWK